MFVRFARSSRLTQLAPMQAAPRASATNAVSSTPRDVFNTVDGFELAPMPSDSLQAGARSNHAVVLQRLPDTFEVPRAHSSKHFVRRVGAVQIAQAHAAYKDTWGADFLAARPSLIDDGESRRAARKAQNAGIALVRFETQGLVKMGVAKNLVQAANIVKALRQAGILDGKNQVSRGPQHEVDSDEVLTATRTLRLSNEQNLKLRDAVTVLKFLHDFGIREAASLFGLETCCGAGTFERPSSWSEWGMTVRHLFDNSADEAYRAQVKDTRAKLLAQLEASN